MDIDKYFVKGELVPVIVQDEKTGRIMMQAYANREALTRTMKTKTAWFWSRSRAKLWNKGETSRNFLDVARIIADCDNDCLLYICRPRGPVCHTGEESCFFNLIWSEFDE